MTSHDMDSRYSDPEARARVAVLFIPLLGIIMDTIPQLHSYIQQGHDRLQNIGVLEDYQGPPGSTSAATINPEIAFAISGSRMYSFLPDPVKNKSPLSSENTRHLLSCFLWIIKNLEHGVLFKWTLSLSPHRLHQMLQVLNVCIPCFEYKGRQKVAPVKRNTQSFRKTPDNVKERLEECIRGAGSARNDLINRRKDRNSTDKLRWRKDQTLYRSQCSDSSIKSKSEIDQEMNHYIEGSLSTETCLIILDALELIVQVNFVAYFLEP